MAMKLYTELATWWPLVSPPSHYVEEAADLLPMLMQAADARPRTLLELGSGGGSLAFHLKAHVRMTLSDVSPAMLHQSRQVNPKCEHVVVDMRTLDLGRTFDLVFIHDAIMYAIDESSLRATLETAARHCRTGGGVDGAPQAVWLLHLSLAWMLVLSSQRRVNRSGCRLNRLRNGRRSRLSG